MKLLSIGTDCGLFEPHSAVRNRQIEYAKKWDEVHILVFGGRELLDQQIASHCYIYSTKSWNRWWYLLDAIRRGQQLLRQHTITHISCQDPFFSGLVGWWLKRPALHLEMQLHTDVTSPRFAYSWGNYIRQWLARLILPKADHVRVVSAKIERGLVAQWGIPASKIEVRPIVVDVSAIKQAVITADLRQRYPQFAKVVLMASRLTPEKNIYLALQAWSIVALQRPDAGLVIVGSGPLAGELKQQAKQLGISSQVVFEPWAEPATLYSYYKTADVFLLTSYFEGYGLTLVEAQAAGCPIVATDVGVAREVGASIAEPNAADVAAKVLALLSS